MRPWIEKGYDIVALVPSCALMLKFEWPLILPEDDDVKLLAKATFDLSEYVVGIARKEGLAPGLERGRDGRRRLAHFLSFAGPEHGPEGARAAEADPRGRSCK